jgi:cholera toxin transcriptional activator
VGVRYTGAMGADGSYRFGIFEVDSATGELRRKGVRVKLHAQPFQVLLLLLARPGEMLTREEICRELWPEGTFVDYEHGVNSAVNRLREALGDKASRPRFVETLARRGYRFVAPVERVGMGVVEIPVAGPEALEAGVWGRMLAGPADLPVSSRVVVKTLFGLLQVMYVGFYVGALANLAEISELMSGLPRSEAWFEGLVVTAAVMIPVRAFLLCAAMFRAPRMREKFLRWWPVLLVMDCAWALAPFLLLHHMSYGLALACATLLVYAPFAQRSLVLMGAAE